ncbi:MAG: glycine cleavage system protein H [Candidatus Cloacimonadota bacterium]|nr:MAG: glycine cleavage system protein H [Candidatus Cloacimonadota bacterium]PIE77651.1 MAG: glycine cleavage system protein H [Candidatus Delongbacteria bacterium]
MVKDDLLYSEEHEYLKVDGDIATVGVTFYAQDQLGDITYVELPEVGDSFDKGETFGTIEAVKAASDLFMPISGEIIEVNEELEDTPETVNKDCYGKGWLVKIKISDKSEVDSLLSADAYKKIIED